MAEKKKIVIDEKAKLIAIAVVIAAATFFLGYNVVYKILSNKIEETRQKIEEEYQRLVLSKDIKKINFLRTQYHDYVYKNAKPDALRDSIASIAEKSDVYIIKMQPGTSQKVGDCNKLSFKVMLRCGYHQLGVFLEAIESIKTYTTVSSLTIDADAVDYKNFNNF